MRMAGGRSLRRSPMILRRLISSGIDAKLAPIYETVRRVRGELAPEKALIGFCGAPWTVATYMIAGAGTPDQLEARGLALKNPERVQRLDRYSGRGLGSLSPKPG